HRRGELRGGLARLVGLGPEPRPVPVLALLAVPSEGIEQRLLLQPRGGPPHGRGAPRDARIRAAPALPPSPRDLPGRRAGRLRDERVGQVRLPQGRRRHRDLPDRLHGDLARPDRLVEARGGLEVIRYVARRILLAVPTLAGIVVLVFLLLHLAPGSPVTAAGGEGGRRLSGRAAEEMRRVYGLDRPLPERFGKWVLRVVRLDLGESFVDRRPVSDRILEALPYPLPLTGRALLLPLLVAIPLGVEAGGRPESAFDRISSAALFALYSTPSFWAALLLQTLFSVKLRWLPLYGVASDPEPPGLAGLTDRLAHLALPVLCLAYGSLAFYARLVRAGGAEARNAAYVRAARARGLSRREALWKHAFRNALLPLVTLLGLVLPGLLSGSVIIERIFAWPGLGRLYFDSILSRDYPVVLALSLVGAVATL